MEIISNREIVKMPRDVKKKMLQSLFIPTHNSAKQPIRFCVTLDKRPDEVIASIIKTVITHERK